MNAEQRALPQYAAPPVVEVAASIQFEPLNELRTAHLGLLWSRFRENFPKTEEHAPREPSFESFGAPSPENGGPRVEVVRSPQVPRLWFVSSDETELVQIQQDRLAFNWRKQEGDEEYPSYRTLIGRFEEKLRKFREFLTEENLGKLIPNQCELLYVNHIKFPDSWEAHRDMGRVVPSVSPSYSDEFLGKPEDTQFQLKYRIPGSHDEPIGRLRIKGEPSYLKDGTRPILNLQLQARGEPAEPTVEEALKFLGVAHRWIVRGFTSITSEEMHRRWERKDA